MPIGRLRKHRTFIGQVGTIVSGRGIAAGIGLLLTPVVARLYSPDDFGLAALFFAIAAIAVQVASLKYESAIALPREDGEALRIATLSYRLVPASCVLLFVAIAVLQLAGSGAGRASQLGHWLWMLPLTVFLMAEQDVLESWLYRQLRFGVVSRSAVIDVSVAQGSRIAFGALGGSSVAGLIAGQLLGVVARLVVQGRAGWQSLAAAIRRAEPGTLRTVAARYSDFAKLSAPAALLNVSNQNLPVILFAAIFSPAVAGFFAMANRLTKAPIQIGSDSVRRVFLQRAARIHNEGRSLRRSYALTTGGLFAIGALPVLALALYGQPALTLLLGAKWSIAGHYAEIIAPWILTKWTSSASNPVFVILRRQRYWLLLHLVLTVVQLGAFAAGHLLGLGPDGTLRLFITIAVAGHLLTMAIAWSLAGSVPRAEEKPA
jgi:O-antigen/teichoic acid export membrane protein